CMDAWMDGDGGEGKKRRRGEEKKSCVETLRATSLQITYFELNDQSNHLAGVLIEKGVQPDSIVGIMMERSIEMIIGILGILKSGGAYLPIDPDYPQERIDYMLKDSHTKILITNKSEIRISKSETNPNDQNINDQNKNQHSRAVSVLNFEHLNLNSIKGCPRRGLQHSAFITQHSNHLAYVIYTSGSTGKPKGVLVEHRNVVRLVKNTNYITFSPRDRLLPTGSLAFDITTFEIWGPLCNGVMLALVSKDILLNTGKLKEVLVNQGITILHLIPALFNQLAASNIALFAGLRYFLVGGDKVSPLYINALRKQYSHLKILHMYGPTENTTFSTSLPVERDYEFNIPIGNPIANTMVYIVDKFGHLQPMGVMGELCVGGGGIARGYLNNPELTADRFKRNVISQWSFVNGDKRIVNSHRSLVSGKNQKIESPSNLPNDQCPMAPRRGGTLGGLSSSWAASINRSKSGAFELNWEKSNLAY
ncbi:MAG: amino acid adenylation domain-containing protein, partial [Acidobacteria bacterium]|nr:amino acid adenylation domain-containing protein [Acidobacteriota bacterium]